MLSPKIGYHFPRAIVRLVACCMPDSNISILLTASVGAKRRPTLYCAEE
jgi:hypothetical protein